MQPSIAAGWRSEPDSYGSLGWQILPYVFHQNPFLSFASRLMNKLLAEETSSGKRYATLLNCEPQEGTPCSKSR